MRAVTDRDGARRADLAAIHIAKAALGWDDETYRDIMQARCGVRSSALLDFAGRKTLLGHLRASMEQLGIQAPIKPGKGSQRHAKAWSPRQRKLWSLWQALADAGLVKHRDRGALDGWIKGQIGVSTIDFCNTHQLDSLIDSAKGWLKRSATPASGAMAPAEAPVAAVSPKGSV